MEDTRTGNTPRKSETGRLAGGLTAAARAEPEPTVEQHEFRLVSTGIRSSGRQQANELR